MDWKSLVSRVLHRSETPSVVVDARKRVRLVNRAMERALGWREHEVLDRPFARAYAAERARKAISHGMETCLRGGARHVEVVLRSREGRAYDALLEMTLVGLPREPALLIEANLRGPSREVPSIPGVEVYEVERGPAGFGRVRYRWPNVGSEGGRCYMIRYGIDRPCSACPIEHIGPERPRCTSILNVADHQYDMVTAERIDEATVR
ncbi:MAG: PAS domain-containing protein, partial [Myxococcota bacterium]